MNYTATAYSISATAESPTLTVQAYIQIYIHVHVLDTRRLEVTSTEKLTASPPKLPEPNRAKSSSLHFSLCLVAPSHSSLTLRHVTHKLHILRRPPKKNCPWWAESKPSGPHRKLSQAEISISTVSASLSS